MSNRRVLWMSGTGLLAALASAPCGLAFLLLPLGLSLSVFGGAIDWLEGVQPALFAVSLLALLMGWYGAAVDARARKAAYGNVAVGAGVPRLLLALTTVAALGAMALDLATKPAIMAMMGMGIMH